MTHLANYFSNELALRQLERHSCVVEKPQYVLSLLNAVYRRLRANDNVVRIDKGNLSPYKGKDNVLCFQEGCSAFISPNDTTINP